MKLLPLLFLTALPSLAQFRSIEVTFEGIGCASCMESLPARIERLRGVESATVDAQQGILKIRLAEQNRVRLEQVRDMIEQDGTKTKTAVVTVKGELSQTDGKWVLQPPSLPSAYEVEAASPAVGTCTIAGEVVKLKPQSGRLVIKASVLTPVR
jgi:cation transport ATPase